MGTSLWTARALALSVLVGGFLLAGCGSKVETAPDLSAGGSGGAGGVSTGGGGFGGTGGVIASGGTGGTAGTAQGGAGGTPAKTNKIDLLLMIDNSPTVADKQDIFASSVPDLVNRLVNPACVDSQGLLVSPQPAKPLDPCPAGSSREFSPVFDIHVGVISSSLGGHGADSCSPALNSVYNPRMEDMSHLITRKNQHETQKTYQDKGFLFWDPTESGEPPGETDKANFEEALNRIVNGTGQDGCGFEAPLEAWYRFLVDPKPYERMVEYDCNTNTPQAGGACRGPQGVDQVVLTQRADFLRPDSMVAIVMLTDEDDCSVKDTWQNYVVLQTYAGATPWQMPRATSACKTDPKSADCMSCVQGDHSNDPECAKGAYSVLEDNLNLRCYRQKQRFGVDFLYPTKRYVDALTLDHLEDGSINPLFCSAPSADGTSCVTQLRDPSLIALTGIVGVPWQDIARNPNDPTQGFKPAAELPWDMIVGDLDNFLEPTDPLMIPSIEPRQGVNPATGQALAPPSSASPGANAINGHEWDIKARNDLQYACIFTLPVQKDCSGDTPACDCADVDGLNNPLCQDPTGHYSKIQYSAKAYPTPRLLTVLKGLGSRAVVASACLSNTDEHADDFGYRQAVRALIDRMRPSL